jgi:hypothetical protein
VRCQGRWRGAWRPWMAVKCKFFTKKEAADPWADHGVNHLEWGLLTTITRPMLNLLLLLIGASARAVALKVRHAGFSDLAFSARSE